MLLVDFGNSVISSDIRKLKRFRSIESDLDTLFTIHKNQYSEFSMVGCQLVSNSEFIICKDRVPITNPRTQPSKGGRLWFVIMKETGVYIRCLLYSANEEKDYQKSNCFRIVQDRLDLIKL